MSYTVLIADDEQHARSYLATLLAGHTDLLLLAQCASGKEVIAFSKNKVPDILLLDIQMPGLNGIETARKLMMNEKRPFIIFTTAFDQYAIEAFRVEAIDYLLKPFSKEDLNNSLNKARLALEQKNKVDFSDRISRLWQRFSKARTPWLEEVVVKVKGLEHRIPLNEVYYFKSDAEYIAVHTAKGKYLQRYALKMLEEQLPPHFLRIHRSLVINQNMIKAYKYLFNNTFQFELNDGTILQSSRSYKTQVKLWLKNKS